MIDRYVMYYVKYRNTQKQCYITMQSQVKAKLKLSTSLIPKTKKIKLTLLLQNIKSRERLRIRYQSDPDPWSSYPTEYVIAIGGAAALATKTCMTWSDLQLDSKLSKTDFIWKTRLFSDKVHVEVEVAVGK